MTQEYLLLRAVFHNLNYPHQSIQVTSLLFSKFQILYPIKQLFALKKPQESSNQKHFQNRPKKHTIFLKYKMVTTCYFYCVNLYCTFIYNHFTFYSFP